MDSTSPFSPVSPATPHSGSAVSPHEGLQPYSTPAHEGLQAIDQPAGVPRPGPYSYQGQIQPDVVPLSVLGDKYGDDNLLPSYPKRRIWGLAARTFWIVVAVVILVLVIAIGVGAGVGGSKAAKHSKEAQEAAASSSSSSLLPSSTSPAASSATQSSSASSTPASASSASSTASKTGTALVGATPVPFTGVLPLDCPNIDGSTYSTASSNAASFKISCSSTIDGNDNGRTFAPSLDGCIEDCATKAGCLAVVFNANLTLSNPLDGNCYFKNSTEGLHTGSYALQASAIYA